MEDDPNKKESKGKRILKKAIRRSSKSSNSQSSVQNGSGVSRSKSFETQRLSDTSDSTQLPKPVGAKDNPEGGASAARNRTEGKPDTQDHKRSSLQDRLLKDMKSKKIVAIQESQNEVFEDVGPLGESPRRGEDVKVPDLRNNDPDPLPDYSKRNLKRKLEEDSGAGTSGASAGASDTDADDRDPGKDKKKKNRCAVCRKKVGLTGFECRCGGLFCAVHRYSDKHDCSFDYRELGAQEIRRNNPVVVSQKIHKI